MTVDTNGNRTAEKRYISYSRGPLMTFAIERPLRGHAGGRGIDLLKYTDLFLIIVALPVFLIAGLPLLGYAGALVGWGGQRTIQYFVEAKAARTEDPKGFFRLMAGSLIGRSWFLVISIFVVGLIERPAGLAAAVTAAIVFTVYLAISVLTRPTSPTVEGQ